MPSSPEYDIYYGTSTRLSFETCITGNHEESHLSRRDWVGRLKYLHVSKLMMNFLIEFTLGGSTYVRLQCSTLFLESQWTISEQTKALYRIDSSALSCLIA